MMSRAAGSADAPESRLRSYQDPCGVARALNLVGERWTLLVIRELLLGPKRFSELRAGLATISPNVLSQRLDDLTERGLVERRNLGPPASAAAYQLTALGAGLEPVLIALATWGSRIALPDSDGRLSPDALILALRTTLRPDPDSPRQSLALQLGADLIVVEVGPTTLTAWRGGPVTDVRATIAVDSAATLRALTLGGQGISTALADGRLTISGDAAAARRFLTRFERPAVIGPRHPDRPDPARRRDDRDCAGAER